MHNSYFFLNQLVVYKVLECWGYPIVKVFVTIYGKVIQYLHYNFIRHHYLHCDF